MTTSPAASGWQVEGSAADNYERYLVPAIFAAWAPRLLDAAAIGSGHHVLDVACGTGAVSRAAAARVGGTGRVVGLDVNPAMLAAAREADAEGAVEWRAGDASELPFPDGTFDAVVCQQGLQFVPDPVAAVAEMRRTAGGGTVAVAVWSPLSRNVVWDRFAEALGRHAGPEAAEIMRSPFRLSDSARLADVFGAAGFPVADIQEASEPARFGSAEAMVREEAISSPLAGPLGALDRRARDALVAEVDDVLATHRTDAGIAFPTYSHLVVARR